MLSDLPEAVDLMVDGKTNELIRLIIQRFTLENGEPTSAIPAAALPSLIKQAADALGFGQGNG